MENRFMYRAWHKKLKKMFDVKMIDFSGYVWEESTFDLKRQKETAYELKDCEILKPTGIKDKKRNPIYSEHICIVHNAYGKKFKGIIIWHINECGFFCYEINGSRYCGMRGTQFEIIGNRYSNPELLKEVV